MPSRTWRVAIALIFALTLLLPLYHLSDARQLSYLTAPQKHDDQPGPADPNRSDDKNAQNQLEPGPASPPPGVFNNTLYRGEGSPVQQQFSALKSPCDGFPKMDDIMFVLKTGATEAFDKLPTQLLTNLQCLDDFLLFSDLEQQIGKYHIYNALDRVAESIKKAHPEFDLYQAQIDCPVSQKECTKSLKGGWDLDKFKFLNIVARTWEMKPDREWYVFGEADTYIVWKSLVHFLHDRVKSKDTPYVGSVAMYGGFPFAHGGSGYVLSGAAMKKMIDDIPNLAAKYDNQTEGECCGDVMLARAAKEVSVKVKQAHPMFNGEKPNTLPFGPGQWCEPILTMHHVNSEEVSALWQYEQTRINKDFIQIKDIYEAFFAPRLVQYRTEWDNLSEDTCYIAPDEEAQKKADQSSKKKQLEEKKKSFVEKNAHSSAAACAKVCESEGLIDDDSKAGFKGLNADEYDKADTETARSKMIAAAYESKLKKDPGFGKKRKCFQWRYHRNGVCCTAKTFKHGVPKRGKEKDVPEWTSGWFVRGIKEWTKQQGKCAVEWKEPRIL
ncbi:hypothetical protein ESCO_006230 [Escovopsis weberi]|uniref:Glycoprotein-N-acetylgalactosamine 3-beta-galactosyltransferase 1 n=1 Tax=Escovopsis weberi TaxID=150374 RepID=A0A0M8N007_ESCWE|nr:hypothetical protein ESCO_006230 [Escovopsis weberi]